MAKAEFPSENNYPSTETQRDPLPVPSLDAATAEIDARSASTALLEEILVRPQNRPYEHWGINE